VASYRRFMAPPWCALSAAGPIAPIPYYAHQQRAKCRLSPLTNAHVLHVEFYPGPSVKSLPYSFEPWLPPPGAALR
jgi:hypothetical protein